MSDENTAPSQAPAVSAAVTPTEPTQSSGDAAQKPGAWYGSVDKDTEGYIANKGWKSPTDLLKSYQNLERLRGVGADKLVKLPDPANAEETKQFYTRLGVPESPDGYKPVDSLEFELDQKVLANLAHEANMTPAQYEKLAQKTAGYFKQLQAEQIQATAERDVAEQLALEQEWGARKDENYQAATKAATQFGLDKDTLDALQRGLGYRKAVELLTKIGRSFGEAKAPTKDPEVTPAGVTPAVARERLNALRGDEAFRTRLMKGDVEAKAKWDNLTKIAFYGG